MHRGIQHPTHNVLLEKSPGNLQEMMNRGVVPTQATERELADAFSSSPSFAASVLQQARRLRAMLASSGGGGAPSVRTRTLR